MLEKKDYEEIAHLMKVIVESDLSPKLELLLKAGRAGGADGGAVRDG